MTSHYAKKWQNPKVFPKTPKPNRGSYIKTKHQIKYVIRPMLQHNNRQEKRKTTEQDKLIIALSPFIFIVSMIFFMITPVVFIVCLFIGFIYLLITWW